MFTSLKPRSSQTGGQVCKLIFLLETKHYLVRYPMANIDYVITKCDITPIQVPVPIPIQTVQRTFDAISKLAKILTINIAYE